MAPAVAMLAGGMSLDELARPIDDPILLHVQPARTATDQIRVIHLDAFGNATTNIGLDVIKALDLRTFSWNGIPLGPLRRTYWDADPGKPLALIGSSGLLEVAVRDGSAAGELGVRVGDTVEAEPSPP
jgi:S-adenosylmethionine hydrolase